VCLLSLELSAQDEGLIIDEPKVAPPAASTESNKIKEPKKICDCRYSSGTPYSERRSLFSGFFGVMAGLYTPTNYKPDFATNKTYANYYGDGQSPNAEAVFGAKINFFLGSLGPYFTIGTFSAQNTDVSAKLSVTPITAGLIYQLDNIFNEPYVVPYFVGGGYKNYYTETVGKLSVTGSTPIAAFYAVGLMFQLDWLDTQTHANGYDDFGIENTFLFIEGRSFLPSTDLLADFSTPLQLNAGLRVEF
jgi:hypothetical protein